jgi:LuxR family maltose regulon positive regulatory protein
LFALARRRIGDEQGARVELERALRLGEPEGYVRPFLHLGEPMEHLLRQWRGEKDAPKARGIRSEYLGKILSAFPHEKVKTNFQRVQHPQLVESLTPREMDVLRLLAEGLTNREIAGRLVISPNTLRVYTTNLYGKLDVHTRAQAVRRAQDLGLI